MSLTIGKITKRSVFAMMKERNIFHTYQRITPYWLSPTINRLNWLAKKNPKKFDSYIRLVDSFLNLAKKQALELKLTLYFPSRNELEAIDIESLINDEEAHKEIVERCYWPTYRKIDLRPLVFISKKYLPKIKI
jgi:hypothetical protein